jgi:hypothetical protein
MADVERPELENPDGSPGTVRPRGAHCRRRGYSQPMGVSVTTLGVTTLDVYGLRIAVGGDWPDVVADVIRDFAWFEAGHAQPTGSNGSGAQPPPGVGVEIQRRTPDYERFSALDAAFVTPRNTVYQAGDVTVVDYFGRALSILDRSRDRLTLQGEDPQLVREAAYNFVLSRVGEHLDTLGLARLHALAIAGPDHAVALVLPSGGGKSTMALRALRDPSVRLLSEDSPILDRWGRLHPFPLRIGVNPGEADALPAEHVRRVERMEFHPKILVDLEAFAASVEPRPKTLRHLVIGRRSLGAETRLERMPRRFALAPLLRESVVGLGLYQGMEFVLQRGLRDTAGKLGVALSRSACCAGGLARASVWRMTLGRDHDRNWDTLRELVG